MRFASTAAIAMLLVLIDIHAAAAQEAGYRLSGVLLSREGEALATIERAAGASVSVRVGDEIDAGYVAEIGDRYVRLSFPESDLILSLRGSPEAVGFHEASRRNGLHIEPDAHNMRYVQNGRLFFEALDKVGASIETNRSALAEGTDVVEEESPGRELGGRLSELLDFPKDADVRTIAGRSFASASEGFGIVEGLLKESIVVRLELERDGEMLPPFYVFPESTAN